MSVARPSELAPPPRSKISASEIWFWAVCIFLLTNPFAFILTGTSPSAGATKNLLTMRAAQEGSSIPLYALRALPLAAGLLFALSNWRSVLFGLRSLVPLSLFLVWAAASLLWTDSFANTANALVALIMLMAAGYLITVRLTLPDFARAMLYSGLVMAAFSLVWIFLLPQYGVHQQTDAAQSVHSGAWRGVYSHKNHLGQLAAIYAAGFLLAGPSIVPHRLLRWGGVAIMLVLIAGTDSASAVGIVIVASVIVWPLLALNPNQRLVAILLAVAGGTVGYFVLSEVLSLLGRDMTFTGRTTIWSTALVSILENPVFGFGFLSPTYGQFTQQIYLIMGVSDPHNAYVDITLGLGFVGLVLFAIAIGAAMRAGRMLFIEDGPAREAALALTGITVAWLVAGLTEANSRPFVSMFALGFISLNIVVYAATVRDTAQQGARLSSRPGAEARSRPDYSVARAIGQGTRRNASHSRPTGLLFRRAKR